MSAIAMAPATGVDVARMMVDLHLERFCEHRASLVSSHGQLRTARAKRAAGSSPGGALARNAKRCAHPAWPLLPCTRRKRHRLQSSTEEGGRRRGHQLVLTDPAIDAVLALYVPPLVTAPAEVAGAIARAAQGSAKPVVACLLGSDGVSQARDILRAAQLPVYPFPESAVIALGRAAAYGRWRARPEGRGPAWKPGEVERARATAAPHLVADPGAPSRWLAPTAVRAVLGAYGIAMPRGRVVAADADLVAVAEEIRWPVALKIVSPTIVHKTDVGGVALGLRAAPELRAAHRELRQRREAGGRLAEVTGFLVETMIASAAGSGVETLVGITRSPGLGDLIAFGLGGVQAEIARDVVFHVNPLTDVDAREMIDRLRGVALLGAFRGRPPVDREAIVDVLLRVSQLAADFPQIAALDINPLLALCNGQGVMALDARIQVGL